MVLTKRETPDRGPVYQIQDRAYGEFEFKVKLPAGTKVCRNFMVLRDVH